MVTGVADKVNREKAMKQAESSLAVEGLFVSKESKELIRSKLRGEISLADFLKRALEVAKNGSSV
jgi:hypothetical protein